MGLTLIHLSVSYSISIIIIILNVYNSVVVIIKIINMISKNIFIRYLFALNNPNCEGLISVTLKIYFLKVHKNFVEFFSLWYNCLNKCNVHPFTIRVKGSTFYSLILRFLYTLAYPFSLTQPNLVLRQGVNANVMSDIKHKTDTAKEMFTSSTCQHNSTWGHPHLSQG